MNPRQPLILTLAALCFFPCGAQANDIDPAVEFYTAFKARAAIELDGNLSEWEGANVIENPRFVIPKGTGFEGANPADIVTHEELGGFWENADDQSVDVRVLYDDENVYLGLVVTDDYHEHAAGGGGGAWNGDSVQLMIADSDRAGQVALINVALLGIEDDEPADDFTVHNEAAPEGTEVFIVRDTIAKTTTYEIKLPIDVVGVDALNEGVQFGLGFAINDGDEDAPGQKGWVGWGPHCVVFGKTPGETGLVTLGGVAPAAGGPPLIAHFPLDSNGNSADGAFVAAKVTDVEFGEAGANANTGTAASFNGASSVIQHDWSEALNPDGDFTLALWAKSNGGAGAWNSPVTSRHDLFNQGETSQGYLIYDSSDTGHWTFWSGNGTDPGNWQTLPSPEPVALGEWQHVAISYDDAEQVKRLYVDGVLVAESDDSIAPNDSTPFNIGAGQDFGNGFWFDGEIDDIGLFGAALTEAQINQVMELGVASLSGGSAPDLLITFDEGEELPEGIEFVGVSEIRDEGGVDDSGYLKVTDAANGQYGAVVFPDLLGGKPVKSFKFSVDFRVGGGTDNPADGFSVNLVRPDDPLLQDPVGDFGSFSGSPNGGEASLPEEGSRTGLGIGFDEWDSGAPDVVGFSVRVDGELITQIPALTRNGDPDDADSLQTGPIGPDGPGDISELTWQPFEVELKDNGKLDISWKGTKVLDNFQTNFYPSPVQVVFGGRTGDANSAHHADNIALTIKPLDVLVVSKVNSSPAGLAFELANSDESVIDKTTIALTVDGVAVTPVVADIEGGASVTYVANPAWLPGQTHTYVLVAKDTNGNDAFRSGAGEVSLRPAQLPYQTPLAGPEGGEGFWGVRYIWGAGSPGSTVGAINLLQESDDPNFAGEVFDTTAEVANLGAGVGYFPDDLPYPEEVEFGDDGLWNGENFVVSYKGTLRITEAGLYTFGVHSDDGFGLRIFGAEFISKNGNGQIDAVSPDTLIHPAPTGDSNTRGVVNLAAGDYPIEFFWYENGGGDNGELYFAKGEFVGDADTDTWELVGGSHLVGPGGLPFQIVDVTKTGSSAAITWDSKEGASYTILKTSDLQEFEELTDGFPSGGETTTFTDENATESAAYYRVKQDG